MRRDGSLLISLNYGVGAQRNVMMAGIVDEIVIFDLSALCLAVVTVNIIWYVVKKSFPG